MVRLSRASLGVALPFVLVGLVGLLGTLQYRWLGQASEAEREQLRRSIERRASEFARDFDLEITRVYLALQDARDAANRADGSTVQAVLEGWRKGARFPGLVRGLYVISAEGPTSTISRLDPASRQFSAPASEWPSYLEPLRTRLAALVPPPIGGPVAPSNRSQVIAITMVPVLPDVPALLISLAGANPPRTPAEGVEEQVRQALHRWLVVDFDDGYVRQTLLPTLLSAQFPETGPSQYRLAVLSASGAALLTRGMPGGSALSERAADAAATFFSIRPDLLPGAPGRANAVVMRLDTAAGEAARGGLALFVEHRTNDGVSIRGGSGPFSQVRVQRAGWRLLVQHPLGSLDAAVVRARQRNLWLGFGILAVLGAGVVLVVINARRSARLAAQQMDFVATVTHELRTPLSVIRVAGHNLSSGVVAQPDQTRQYGALVEREGRRLSEMVEQVLDFAGLSGRRPIQAEQPVDLIDVARDAVELCQAQADEAGVDLVLDGEREPALVSGDRGALLRAARNLVANAVKHGGEGKWVRVSVTRTKTRRGEDVRLAVTDRGPGIAPEDLPHVFEPFYRGRGAIEMQVHGNGLGLSLVKRVAEAHGGRVEIVSHPGQETRVTLALPVRQSRVAS